MSDGWTTGAACPPGYSRPAPIYDCRPNVSGQTYLQEDLARIAARYVDDGSTSGQSTGSQTTASVPVNYQMPAVQQQPVVASGLSGGIDNTTLLIIGTVIVFFLIKR